LFRQYDRSIEHAHKEEAFKLRSVPILLATVALTALLTACSAVTDPSKNSESTPISSVSPTPTQAPAPTNPQTAAPSATASTLSPKPVSSPANTDAKNAFEKRVKETIDAIKQKDMKHLAELVHPDKGIQFSPYAYVDTKKNVRIKANELSSLWKDGHSKLWGQYDGSGEPIQLTFPAYWERFVYDHDYANAPKIGYNKVIGTSTTKNNLFETYPKDEYMTVEYHFDGFDPKFGGNDWASLRLVFINDQGEWFLVAAVHDQWTT
jgi:hypothetical protein